MDTNLNEDQLSNDGKLHIETGLPYRVEVEMTGSSDLLFKRWSNEDVAEKAAAKKGSKAKKTDNLEAAVWRNEEGLLCMPTEYLRMSTINSAKYHQDPRSSRKSAMDLFKAGLISMTDLCVIETEKKPLGTMEWDYEDKRRVQVQRNGVTRTRPAMHKGWKSRHIFMITVPEYIGPEFLHEVMNRAGILVGVGDFRPSFGRFNVTSFKVLRD
jgi:hypothetical protein